MEIVLEKKGEKFEEIEGKKDNMEGLNEGMKKRLEREILNKKEIEKRLSGLKEDREKIKIVEKRIGKIENIRKWMKVKNIEVKIEGKIKIVEGKEWKDEMKIGESSYIIEIKDEEEVKRLKKGLGWRD